MQLDRYGTGKISGWQLALVAVPLLGVAILGVGAVLVYFATHGMWGAFLVILGFEVVGLIAGGYVYLHPRGPGGQTHAENLR